MTCHLVENCEVLLQEDICNLIQPNNKYKSAAFLLRNAV